METSHINYQCELHRWEHVMYYCIILTLHGPAVIIEGTCRAVLCCIRLAAVLL